MPHSSHSSAIPWAKPSATVAVIALVLLICFLAQSSGAQPGPAKGRLPNISLTAYFSDYDSQNLPCDTASDGLGAYHDNVDSVASFLTPNGYNGLQYGDWKFNTYSSATR